jgi:uncharacterized protein
MHVARDLPYDVHEVENVWIPLRDGTRLSARLWLPAGAGETPAIVEYIPYGKRWGTRHRDEPMHRYFAGHGYAAVRIDLRGSGESDGLLLDEYTELEHRDGLEALAWVAAQPWCSGRLGMIGKSWGGFNALQLAALQPKGLEAVIAVCAADDRYADDAHYMGGCLLTENLVWGSLLFTLNATPPDPVIVGERWREMWLERLERMPLYVETWMRHPFRDAYWRRGSVCEHFERIQCPVYAVSGWADGYSNAVPRVLAGLRVPAKGLIGPWAHVYPHTGTPGPAIGFLQEALRWWDQWLRDRDTGIVGEPAFRAWMQEWVEPGPPAAQRRPGRWVVEERWPSPRIERVRHELVHSTGPFPLALDTPLGIGRQAGAWCAFEHAADIPGDQREDDERSVCFDLAIGERLEILGAPHVLLRLTCDRPFGQVIARLCDVDASGASLRVSYDVLDLAHRDGHERPSPPVPGEPFDVTLALNDCGHAFPAGHRLRVALSTSYWPLIWPAPAPFALTVHGAWLELPVRPPRAEDASAPPFARPEAAPGVRFDVLEPAVFRREQAHEDGELILRNLLDVTEEGDPAMARLEPLSLDLGHGIVEEFRIREGDPASARARITQETVTRRGAWQTRVRTLHALRADARHYYLEARCEVLEGAEVLFQRDYASRVPRPAPAL